MNLTILAAAMTSLGGLNLPISALAVVVGFREARSVYRDRKNGKPNHTEKDPTGWITHCQAMNGLVDKLSGDDAPRKHTEALANLNRTASASLEKLCEIKAAIVNGNQTHHHPGGGR